MSNAANHLLRWVIPETLAGMPMPYVHPDRRMNHGGALEDYVDDLAVLHCAGIRGVVSLLNLPGDESVYQSAGFSFLCLPIPNGGAPTFDQAVRFVSFAEEKLSKKQAIAVHCEAGLGRTGTMLAVYLISIGKTASEAIHTIRAIEKSAIETDSQIQFLEHYANRIKASA
jgi:atypical dual specificity phosphatase